jgi:hypothetical protein
MEESMLHFSVISLFSSKHMQYRIFRVLHPRKKPQSTLKFNITETCYNVSNSVSRENAEKFVLTEITCGFLRSIQQNSIKEDGNMLML